MKLIKIPFSGGGMGRGNGANEAPNKIVELLPKKSFQVEEIVVDEYNISQSHKNIEELISKIKEKAIILGGDHSISYPIIKAFSKNNKNFKLIIFDAHPDLVNNFIPPTHEDYLKVLIEQKIVQPKNILLIGVRNADEIEQKYIEKKKINTCSIENIPELIAIIQKFCTEDIYLSIDIDVIDPKEAPGTGYPEQNGITIKNLLIVLKKLKETSKLKMIDLVEVNPKQDINDKTSILGAKIVSELKDF